MGTSSAGGSPIMDDDDSGGDYNSARDIINDFTFGHFTTTKDSIFRTSLRRRQDDLYVSDYQPPPSSARTSNLHRSKTNAADDRVKFTRSNSKPETATNAVSSKYVSAAVTKFQSCSNDNTTSSSFDNRNSNVRSSTNKGGKSKLLSSYLSKAKEGIKAVTSTITGADEPSTRKDRPSRAPKPKTQKRSGRSASVGAPAFRQENYLNVPTDDTPVTKSTLSPRSQLKQVRQNLKKVSADYRYGVRDFNALKAIIKPTEKDSKADVEHAPSVPERIIDDKPPVSPRSPPLLKTVRKSSNSETAGSPLSPTRSRPLSLIENQQSFLELQKAVAAGPPPSPSIRKKSQSSLLTEDSSSSNNKRNIPPSPASLRKKSISSSVNDENAATSNGVVEMRSKPKSRTPSLRLKRRSWDLSQTMDMRLQVSAVSVIL